MAYTDERGTGRNRLEEKICKICKVRPAVAKGALCEECSDPYTSRLKSATDRTRKFIEQAAVLEQSPVNIEDDIRPRKVIRTVQARTVQESARPGQQSVPQVLETQELQALSKRKPAWMLIGYFMLGVGLLALVFAIELSSTVLTFIGLGLTFWGILVFFIRPQNYVRSDLLNATALSSLKTIDKIMLGLGYRERGVYIPSRSEKVVVFIPSEPFSMIPKSTEIEGKTFLEKPAGLLVTPPGLALSNVIESRLGFNLENCGVEVLVRALPKVLVEDLESARDVEIEVKGESVRIRLVDSIYGDFCQEALEVTGRRCALGCPMCSALACILAIASGKPVLFEDEKSSEDKQTIESSYKLLTQSRL